jgi:hypothetical protein
MEISEANTSLVSMQQKLIQEEHECREIEKKKYALAQLLEKEKALNAQAEQDSIQSQEARKRIKKECADLRASIEEMEVHKIEVSRVLEEKKEQIRHMESILEDTKNCSLNETARLHQVSCWYSICVCVCGICMCVCIHTCTHTHN